MKKIKRLLLASLFAFTMLFSGCNNEAETTDNNNPTSETGGNESGGSDGHEDATLIDGSSSSISWAFITYDLSQYNNKTVTINFSVDMKVINSGSSAQTLLWQVNTSGYPIVASKSFAAGTSDWTKVSGTKEVTLAESNCLYLSTNGLTKEDFKIYLDNVKIECTVKDSSSSGTGSETTDPSENNWLSVTSLKETFVDGGFFDRFGLACELNELSDADIAKGLVKHSNTTTPGNELKPQFVLWQYSQPAHTASFTASNGKTISVPNTINFSTKMDPYLQAAKAAGIQIRGHVLTWHSQTFEWFFTEDYAYTVTYDSDGNPNNLVDKETMTARHEWYIKSVLEHVAEWEAENGYGEGNHLIYSWDVVNEAVADDAADSDTGYLRGSTSGTSTAEGSSSGCTSGGGSRWYQIYGDEEFIVNAFRFANAYAPSDVTLCYNDYNEYLNYNDGKGGSYKTNGIVRLLTAVLNGSAETVNGESVKPRIDAMAMQSHVDPSWMSVSSYEGALKKFLALDLDVQVTEFDIATTVEDDTTNWSDYFTMFLKYSKKGSEISKYNGHHITGFTIWGINDENSWISKSGSQYPLLFTKTNDEYIAKDCFFSVIDTASGYSD